MTYLNNDVWNEIKQYLIIPPRPKNPHPHTVILSKYYDIILSDVTVPMFTLLRYFAFKPLSFFGTNSDIIHKDYHNYWGTEYDGESDMGGDY